MSLNCSSSLTCEDTFSQSWYFSSHFNISRQPLFCHHVLLDHSELFLSVHWTDKPMHVVRSWNNIFPLVVINKPEALKTVMCLIFYSCNLKRGFVWSRPMYGLVDRLNTTHNNLLMWHILGNTYSLHSDSLVLIFMCPDTLTQQVGN